MGEYYHQILGTAMGTKCAPPYSCIHMGNFEAKKIIPLSELIKFWKRFIDDIFFLFFGNQAQLDALIEAINNLHPTLKFTFKYSQSQVDFLDTTIYVGEDRKLYSTLYTKPTDTFALLHYNSFHPTNTKKSIIYSQVLRYRMLITSDSLLQKALKQLKTNLIFRGYPKSTIDREIQKISHYTQKDILMREKADQQPQKRRLIFTFPHNIHINELKTILHRHWYLIQNDKELEQIWDGPPMVAVQRHKNLKDVLVHSKQPKDL